MKTIGANSTVRLLEDPPRCGTRAIHTCPPGFKAPEPDECVRDWRVPGISKGKEIVYSTYIKVFCNVDCIYVRTYIY